MVRSPPTATTSELRLRHRNTRILVRLSVFATGMVVLYAIAFERLMEIVEGQSQTFLTGLYWTVSTMTTLGLGDVVFTTIVGRLFTVLVLGSGIVLIFFILPFAFIRFFYAPWLETRKVPSAISDHVIVTSYANIAPGLVERLDTRRIPYFVIEPDPSRASQLHDDGISVFTGDIDDRQTYERLRASEARLILANREDTTNTNITLTVRELSQRVPLVATVDNEASIDILEFSGATRVLALKQRLGHQLALRLNCGTPQTHQIGTIHGLVVAELPVHNTPYANRPLRELRLRETLGINIIGIIGQSRFRPAGPDTVFTDHNVPIVVGTAAQMRDLDDHLANHDAPEQPVLIIGSGKVGSAAATALKRRGVPVHMVEKRERAAKRLGDLPDRVIIGDAAEREVLMEAGLKTAPGVIISTNDDAMNIYLTLYCRRLVPDIRIVSRINHQRNMDAIRRAGADLALSHDSLGIQAVLSMLGGHDLLMLGEGVELQEVAVPQALVGTTLAASDLAARTGLNVIAIQRNGTVEANPDPSEQLATGNRLFAIGEPDSFKRFAKTYA